ncbi:citryl-CoA lyase [Shewanella sp. VB17]|uniref:citrate/2-methylcitrate synthase n=1 Tax=Shewanella sp. VB17 TaxID=2739432 RepID=UPI00156492BE|nr:citrate/2-methylcitrate synthase [Shewanella sp. VB17]NRD74090.1 citryl-CoA lyase [Shewanella sp. VB17]
MKSQQEMEPITTEIWQEIPDEHDPFVAKTCVCAGFNVFEDMLGKASWIEYLYLLFQQQQPSPYQARLLNDLAVAIANAGPRDHSVQAAMSAAAGGSTFASCLMAALAVGAGQLNGGQEIYHAVTMWQRCSQDLALWQHMLTKKTYLHFQLENNGHDHSTWPTLTHAPGFSLHGLHCAAPTLQTLEHLANITDAPTESTLSWLLLHRHALEQACQRPLSMTGIVAATFTQLALDPQQSELLYLLLRLPGAAAHALEQHRRGWRDYPFHPQGIKLMESGSMSPVQRKIDE